MEEIVEQLLAAEGISSVDKLDINQPLEYEAGEHIYDLVIEKIDAHRLSVGQYYTQRMDQMHAPEVVFDTSGDTWIPVEYTNHDTTPHVYEYDETGVNGLNELLRTWEKNLRTQFSEYLPSEGENQ